MDMADTAVRSAIQIQEGRSTVARSGCAWGAVLLIAVQSVLLAYSAYVHSPTLNEPAHLAAGISHWQLGDFELYRVNPPLVRMVAALPVLLAGVETDWHRLHRYAGVRSEFAVGDDLIAANGERSFLLFMIARWACIPFAWIGGMVCFLWARELYGHLAGLMAVALWSFSPNILAHGSLITPDAPATALFALACFLFWRWLRKPGWKRAVLAGAALGMAELAKSTFSVMYLFLPLLWLLYRSSERAQMCARIWRREGAMLLVCLSVSVFVTNLGYTFNGSFTRLGEFRFNSRALSGQDSFAVDNRFEGTWLGRLPIPFPEDYILGLDSQRCDFEHLGRPSYLRGAFKQTGWWYYYLYALAIKVPLGVWGLLFLTIAWRLSRRLRVMPPCDIRDEFALVSPALLILILVSSQTGFSEHLRYVLPIAPPVFIWISQAAYCGVLSSERSGKTRHASPRKRSPGLRVGVRPLRTILASALLCWSIASSLWVYPHSLAHFNELVGGPTGGHAHLLGSNVDWGQDLRYLKWWLDEHPGMGSLYIAYCGRGDPRSYGIDYSGPPPPAPGMKQIPELRPGCYAISVNFLRGYPWFVADGRGGYVAYERGALIYFLTSRPTAVVGASIYIFHIE